MKYKTRKQKLKARQKRGHTPYGRMTESTLQHEQIIFEADLHLSEAKGATGKEWEVTIIGARKPGDLVSADGRTFIRSKNNRLYDTQAIAESAALWDGVKVYDNHLTQAEFEQKQGMRSPSKEWLGTIVKPRWDAAKNQLRGIFKVVEDTLATKLKNAHDQGVLGAIGLSIDTFPKIGQEIALEGMRFPVIEGFEKILSVDLVGDPAAGGAFERLIAANTSHKELLDMDENKLKEMFGEFKKELSAEIPNIVQSSLAEALPANEEETPAVEAEEVEEPEVEETDETVDAAEAALQEAKQVRFDLTLERTLNKSKLTDEQRSVVESAFSGRIADQKEVDAMVKRVQEAVAASDPTGHVQESGGRIEVGLNEDDKIGIEFTRLVMGNEKFRTLSETDDPMVKERIQESDHYKAWLNNGKPNTGKYARMSSLFYDWFGGDPLMSARAFETATTSSLATVVKNTVNIMTAADYSVRERWWDPLVSTEEVDTIDQSTLARVYGVDSLSVVNEGAAYTELPVQDEEETADFVKKGNYIGITLETLMRDKINYVRRIPRVLSNSWWNTLSDLVSGVFTVNSATGPVLSDTGALFNATAVTTAGGHANLLTTAFGTDTTAYIAARLAMRKQTDQPLGVGRRLGVRPQYLLVPYDLEIAAQNVINSEVEPGASNSEINPVFRESNVIGVPTFTDANDWALVADPRQFPAIWLIFPRGQRTPQLFSSDQETQGAMFTNDELRFKVRMMTYRFSATYDCAPVSDFRPLHKSNVA